MNFRNHFIDLKSDVLKINTNVKQLSCVIFKKKILIVGLNIPKYVCNLPPLIGLKRIKSKCAAIPLTSLNNIGTWLNLAN